MHSPQLDLRVYSGAGNLFSVLQADAVEHPERLPAGLVQRLCAPNAFAPAGTEGLLIVVAPTTPEAEFDVHFYNPDGSSSMMCGNGSRCAYIIAAEQGLLSAAQDEHPFRMAGRLYRGRMVDTRIGVRFAAPDEIQRAMDVQINDCIVKLDMINLGSDHVVLTEEEFARAQNALEMRDDRALCALIRKHSAFARGTNVNLVAEQEHDAQGRLLRVSLRTYERGVENFTGACGTGALASALSILLRDTHEAGTTSALKLVPPSGEELEVQVHWLADHGIAYMELIGPARELGHLSIERTDNA